MNNTNHFIIFSNYFNYFSQSHEIKTVVPKDFLLVAAPAPPLVLP